MVGGGAVRLSVLAAAGVRNAADRRGRGGIAQRRADGTGAAAHLHAPWPVHASGVESHHAPDPTVPRP